MAEELKKVTPGDLIKATQWNLMIDSLMELMGRVGVLESAVPTGDKIIITDLLPLGDVEMGTELQIIGKNFGIPSLAAVTIAGVQQEIKGGSTDSLLLVDVSGIINLPSNGIVTLIVSNQKGVASRQLKLVSAATTVLTGLLAVQPPTPPLVPLNSSPNSPSDYVFIFPLVAQTSMEGTYTLTPSVTPSVNAAGWKAAIVDSNGNTAPTEILIPHSPPESPANLSIRVKVTIPANVPAMTNFQVGIEIKSKTQPPVSGTRFATFQTNTTAAPPSTDIKLVLGDVSPLAANDGSGLLVKPDATKKVTAHFPVTVKDAATYNILTPTLLGDPNNRFTVTLKNNPPNFQTFQPNDSVTGDVIVDIRGTAGANTDATLVVKVAKANSADPPGEIQHPLHIKP